MKVIGLTGRKRSGKDTAGAALVAMGFTRKSFAHPIKLMLAALLLYQGVPGDVIERMLEGDLKEVNSEYLNGRSPRHAMQTLGTEWGRGLIADSIWVDVLLRSCAGHEKVVVTDVRFPNEVDALRSEFGAEVYRVVRPGLEAANDNHPSETQIDSLAVDGIIQNVDLTAAGFTAHVLGKFKQ